MKKILLPLLVTIIFATTGCSNLKILSIRDKQMPFDSTTEKTNLVSIKNNKFDPKSVSVLSNSEVTFENLDKTPHTVAADPHPTHTSLPDLYLGPIYKNSPATYVFKIPGTYKVHLEDNPSSIGEIVVE